MRLEFIDKGLKRNLGLALTKESRGHEWNVAARLIVRSGRSVTAIRIKREGSIS
jgi:hypothetical protein